MLHVSGYGNQVGMLLLHLSLAAISNRTLVLPPLHQPLEHRSPHEAADQISADEAFNLTALAPIARVLSHRQWMNGRSVLLPMEQDLLTFTQLLHSNDAAAQRGKRRHGQRQQRQQRAPRPLRLAAEPVSALAAAARVLTACHDATCSEGEMDGRRRRKRRRRRRGTVTPGRGGGGDDDDGSTLVYCHLPSCRARTRRACKRLASGCSRTAQRLPNNYLFAHRLPALLCGNSYAAGAGREGGKGGESGKGGKGGEGGKGGASGKGGAGGKGGEGGDAALAAALDRHQRLALRLLSPGAHLRSQAASLGSHLGPSYAAVHARLADANAKGGGTVGSKLASRAGGIEDAEDAASSRSSGGNGGGGSGTYAKGVPPKELPRLIGRLVRRMDWTRRVGLDGASPSRNGAPPSGEGAVVATADAARGGVAEVASAPTLYIASNRPNVVRSLMPQIAAEVARAVTEEGKRMGVASIRVMGWHDIERARSQLTPTRPMPPPLTGLRAALIDHEVCASATLGFAGSSFSTWSNLIGGRRLASGQHTPQQAYMELQSAATVLSCAAAPRPPY